MDDFNQLKDKIDLEKVQKYMDLADYATKLQEKYDRGAYISDKELEPISALLHMSIEDTRKSLNGENIEIPNIEFSNDETFVIPNEPQVLKEEKARKTKKVIKVNLDKQKLEEKQLQNEFEIQDQKYQAVMKRSDLSKEELQEVCDFYHVDYDDMLAELKENKLEKCKKSNQDTETYKNDKKSRKKFKNIFKSKK